MHLCGNMNAVPLTTERYLAYLSQCRLPFCATGCTFFFSFMDFFKFYFVKWGVWDQAVPLCFWYLKQTICQPRFIPSSFTHYTEGHDRVSKDIAGHNGQIFLPGSHINTKQKIKHSQICFQTNFLLRQSVKKYDEAYLPFGFSCTIG